MAVDEEWVAPQLIYRSSVCHIIGRYIILKEIKDQTLHRSTKTILFYFEIQICNGRTVEIWMCDMMMEVIYGPMMEVHFLSGTFSVIDLPDDLLDV